MRRLSRLVVAGTVLLSWTGNAAAAGNSQAALALHIAIPPPASICSPGGLTRYTIRNQVVLLSGPGLLFFYVYLFACNGSENPGISGFDCGIHYQGGFSGGGGYSPVNVFSWNLCADSEAPVGWPGPGGSNHMTWNPDNCQQSRSEASDPTSVPRPA